MASKPLPGTPRRPGTIDTKPHERPRTKSLDNRTHRRPKPKTEAEEPPVPLLSKISTDEPVDSLSVPLPPPSPNSMICFVDTEQQPGLLVTDELDAAIEACKGKVERISRDCRAKNRKFRDIEFDLENDAKRCLYGIGSPGNPDSRHADVLRATQIFENPQFFSAEGAANSNDIMQGKLGDCWFLSALAIASTTQGLVEKVCVARDEQVGVYGFVFFKDDRWVDVIVDDQLFTQIPKFEELTTSEQELYHEDKSNYNRIARKGGKTLYFAKSGTRGETWVPLIEKAYAKLHGNYDHLNGGTEAEALEDLTGGVATFLLTKDILDPDRFWVEELCRANKDRLFGCSVGEMDSSRSGEEDVDVQGLVTNHAYSVLRAVECKGKRFVVIRNPWGRTEWTGPWSDGSKEWKGEWLEILPELGHVFGDDGQFIMEYNDFLETWADINRTVLFDSSWVIASYWLNVPVAPAACAWTYGDVSFTLYLPEASPTVIVLSQLNTRYFQGLQPSTRWSLDFALVKLGEEKPMAQSSHAWFCARGVSMEVNLDKGNYIVYVRIARHGEVTVEDAGPLFAGGCTLPDCDCGSSPMKSHALARIVSDKIKSLSIAKNFDPSDYADYVPKDLDSLIQRDLQDYYAYMEKQSSTQSRAKATVKKKFPTVFRKKQPYSEPEVLPPMSKKKQDGRRPSYDPYDDDDDPREAQLKALVKDQDEVTLGLKVYTHKDCPAVVMGRLKSDLQ